MGELGRDNVAVEASKWRESLLSAREVALRAEWRPRGETDDGDVCAVLSSMASDCRLMVRWDCRRAAVLLMSFAWELILTRSPTLFTPSSFSVL